MSKKPNLISMKYFFNNGELGVVTNDQVLYIYIIIIVKIRIVCTCMRVCMRIHSRIKIIIVVSYAERNELE